MNLKLNLNLDQLKVISKYRGLITVLAVTGLIGFTTYQISQVTSTQPDPAYVKEQTDKLSSIKLRISPETLQGLQELQSAGDTNIIIQPGKNDPFSLN